MQRLCLALLAGIKHGLRQADDQNSIAEMSIHVRPTIPDDSDSYLQARLSATLATHFTCGVTAC